LNDAWSLTTIHLAEMLILSPLKLLRLVIFICPGMKFGWPDYSLGNR
jgi:hypothetical protein